MSWFATTNESNITSAMMELFDFTITDDLKNIDNLDEGYRFWLASLFHAAYAVCYEPVTGPNIPIFYRHMVGGAITILKTLVDKPTWG
jgi:hypothetical protein